MAKKDDFIKEMQELASKAGLDAEQAKALEAIAANDAIREGLVTRSNYSRDLDAVKAKATTEATEKATTDAKAFYDNWYQTEAKPAYDKALSVQELLGKYQSTYGTLDGTPDPTNSNPTKYITPEEAQKMVTDATSATQAAFIDMQKKSMRVATQHLHDFNETLDPNDLEKFAKDQGYSDIDIAYDKYVEPRKLAKQQEDWEAKVKAAKEEGVKEGYSRQVATSPGGREYVNPFTKPNPNADNPDAGRDSFFAEWDEQANQ